MRTLIMTTAALALAAAAPAFAGNTNTAAGPTMGQPGMWSSGAGSSQTNDQLNSPSAGRMGAALQQKIHHELSQAGFTDIKVMPQSFLVRAKDSSGNPVMMVINPDSVTAVTQMSGNAATAQNGSTGGSAVTAQDGSTSGNGAMGSSTMNDSAHAGSAINAPNGNGTPTTVH